jgi:hypothetical protein
MEVRGSRVRNLDDKGGVENLAAQAAQPLRRAAPTKHAKGIVLRGRAFRIPFTEIVAVEALQLNQPYATGYPPASDSLIRFLEHVGRVERRDSISVSVRPTHRGPQCVAGLPEAVRPKNKR